MSRYKTAALLIAIFSIGCGGTATNPVAPAASSNTSAPDLTQVTEGVVREFRALNLDVVMAERLSAGALTVIAQRIDIPRNANESIYVHLYATAELAANEAARLGPDGNLIPQSGMPRVIVDWLGRVSFHLRDRIIVRYSGCDREFVAAMARLFGPPIVVAGGFGFTPCDLPR